MGNVILHLFRQPLVKKSFQGLPKKKGIAPLHWWMIDVTTITECLTNTDAKVFHLANTPKPKMSQNMPAIQ